ncbi:RBP1A protein, partial [Serilophus lunatus]|nr:RBP1A protein [Serilophus lunatus]
VEHSGSLVCASSSEEISPTKFSGCYHSSEPSPTHDRLVEPSYIVSDDEQEQGKKKGHFKKKKE